MTSNETIFRRTWRAALTRGSLRVPIEDPLLEQRRAKALSFKTSLYRSVKAIREQREVDPELFEAITQLSVRFEMPGYTAIVLGPKLENQFAASLRQILDEVAVGDTEEDEAAESLRRLADIMKGVE